MGQLAIIAVLVRYRGHQLQIRVQSHHRRCVRQLRDVRHLVIEVFDVSAKPRSRRPRLVDRGDDQIGLAQKSQRPISEPRIGIAISNHGCQRVERQIGSAGSQQRTAGDVGDLVIETRYCVAGRDDVLLEPVDLFGLGVQVGRVQDRQQPADHALSVLQRVLVGSGQIDREVANGAGQLFGERQKCGFAAGHDEDP
ncbi:MAG: hypothetical protein E6417_34555, partial [Bradyrhizobium sp.]|nr:hypothetical protein [Bradyrhizobium sp.]